MPFSDVFGGKMSSQYTHHSHYQSPSSSTGSDKPWDIVAAAAAAAATNIKLATSSNVGAFNYNQGFQQVASSNSLSGSSNGTDRGSYQQLINGAVSTLASHQNLQQYVDTQNNQQSSWQESTTAGGGRLYYASSQQASPQQQQQHCAWVDPQHRQMQQQVLQQAHQQAQLLSGNVTSYFAAAAASRLTSQSSPLNNQRSTTSSGGSNWSPKLPQHFISTASSLLDDNHPHQALPHYVSSSGKDVPSYKGLLASADPGANVGSVQIPHQSFFGQATTLAYHHQRQSYVGGQHSTAQPLYHSSLELEMLRSLANSNKTSVGSSTNYLTQSQGGNAQEVNDEPQRSAYLTPVKRERSPSPQILNSTDLEAAKTMLSIQTNVLKDAPSEMYQQISPATSSYDAVSNNNNIESSQGALTPRSGYSNSDLSFSPNAGTKFAPTNDVSMSKRSHATAQQINNKSTTEHHAVPTVALTDNIERSSTPTSAIYTQENIQSGSFSSKLASPSAMSDKFSPTSPNNVHNIHRSSSARLVIDEYCDSVDATSPAGVSVVVSRTNSSVQGFSPAAANGRPSPNSYTAAPLSDIHSSNYSASKQVDEASDAPPQPIVYKCNICKYSNKSKFHFNSHMNTHADHKCTFCDYTSRTEGRLKRHMKDSHTTADAALKHLECDDSGGRCSPPSPDENTALMEQDIMVMVSSIADPADGSSKSGDGKTSSKGKTYRCKQCTHVATSKTEFWLHQKNVHIKGDRVLSCPRCLFVTEYKHHLEYHLRNHFGSKPFKCTKCNYSCVNKSMLNSHMKSHSNFYQYRCDDCTYATKYCHSLKMHLRKYSHKPASIINPDGTSLDSTIIDVYGNRRGPRPKRSSSNSSTGMPSMTSLLPPISMSQSPVSVATSISNNTQLVPLMEALQNTYLKQQQDLTTAMVTSIATLGAQLPIVPSFIRQNEANLVDVTSVQHSTSSTSLKCSLCDFETFEGKDVLTAHVMAHIMKSKDLIYGSGGSDRAFMSASTTSSSSTPNEHLSGSHHSDGNARMSVTPKDEHRSRSSSFALAMSGETASPTRISPLQEQDSNSPTSASYGKNSGDESNGVGGADSHPPTTRRRKGKAYKLDKIALRLQGRQSPAAASPNSPELMEDMDTSDVDKGRGQLPDNPVATTSNVKLTMDDKSLSNKWSQLSTTGATRLESHCSDRGPSSNVSATIVETRSESARNDDAKCSQPMNIDWSQAYVCDDCEIAFKDCIMYTIHMGYHDFREPFKCNMCGHVSNDRLSMFLHIARAPHR